MQRIPEDSPGTQHSITQRLSLRVPKLHFHIQPQAATFAPSGAKETSSF